MKRLSRSACIALIVLGVAIAFIVVGVILGEPLRVWQRAALICYECIGLG